MKRRDFLHGATAITASSLAMSGIGRSALSLGATPMQSLQVAVVGVNGMGWSDLSSVGSHKQVKFVGFCDIDSQRFDQADKGFPG